MLTRCEDFLEFPCSFRVTRVANRRKVDRGRRHRQVTLERWEKEKAELRAGREMCSLLVKLLSWIKIAAKSCCMEDEWKLKWKCGQRERVVSHWHQENNPGVPLRRTNREKLVSWQADDVTAPALRRLIIWWCVTSPCVFSYQSWHTCCWSDFLFVRIWFCDAGPLLFSSHNFELFAPMGSTWVTYLQPGYQLCRRRCSRRSAVVARIG